MQSIAIVIFNSLLAVFQCELDRMNAAFAASFFYLFRHFAASNVKCFVSECRKSKLMMVMMDEFNEVHFIAIMVLKWKCSQYLLNKLKFSNEFIVMR